MATERDDWRLTAYALGELGAADAATVEELLARDELVVQRGGQRPERTVDLRPLILSLAAEPVDGGEGAQLSMRLRTGSHGGARPQEVVALLGLEEGEGIILYHRTGLYAGSQAAPAAHRSPLRRWSRSRRANEGHRQT